MSKTYAKFRPLNSLAEQGLEGTFQQLAQSLHDSGESAKVQLRILRGTESNSWCLDLIPQDCKVYREFVEKPNFEIVTREETWIKIAEGSLSPLDALLQGKLRLRGDTELGKRLFQKLSDGQGEISTC